MAEGFRVARPLLARAGSSSGARATFAGTEPGGTIGPIAGVEVHVALCYYPEGSTIARYDIARYDTPADVYVGAPPCEDVSCQVQSYASHVGRDRPLERFRAGTATLVLDDPDGKWSPWRTLGDVTEYATVRPGIGVDVWVTIAGTDYPRFSGRVVAITDLFDTTGRHEVQFDAVDYLSLLAAYDGIEQAPVGIGELSGSRVTRICDTVMVDRPRDFDSGTITLQGTTLAKNALDEVGMTCDTELGAFWSDRTGTYVFRDRNGLVDDPRYTAVQAVFGDACDGDEIEYREITAVSDTDLVANVVSIAREGGTAVTLEDGASASLYGRHTYRRFDLIHDDPAQSPIIAQRHLDFYAYAANRIEQLAPHVTAETLPALLPLDVLWRIEVRRRATGFQIVAELQIQAIRESITPTEWTLDFTTFSADAIFDAGRYDVAADLYDSALYAY